MEEKEVATIVASGVGGGALWQLCQYALGYFKARSEKDGQIVDKTLDYAAMLRKDIDELKIEVQLLRKELLEERVKNAREREQFGVERETYRNERDEDRDMLKSVYAANAELKWQNAQYQAHLATCGKTPVDTRQEEKRTS